MQTRYRNLFTTIRTEGAILPPDLLQRISSGDSNLEGLTPESYHLSGERLNEATNRSWSRLEGAWNVFKTVRDRLPESDLGTSVTRERWLLTLFQELGYGRLLTARAIEIDEKSYPISHGWQNTPIHLLGFRVDLDKRAAGVAGAARSSPHSLVQELLNRSDDHLWAFVSNGLRLRILRDNVSLTRQAYVEFDLEAMMDGEVYADFVLLWLLCHESRVESEKPESCWLEKWSRTAQKQGTRALENLRDGVEEAINALGGGFLTHSANGALRQKLQSGELDKQDYYRQLLRFVYRLLFLFVAEDRELLLDPDVDEITKERYTLFYSTARIRQLAERRRSARHGDLIYGLWLVMDKLGSADGCPELGLPALGSFLFDQEAMSDLTGLDIANSHLLDAVRALAFITDGNKRRPVDYKNLRSEELGSVYESLLELHPEMNVDAGIFELRTAGGNERKTTGSYYTPDSLVQCLLDSALDPVLDEAVRQPNPEKAILDLKVCDPAAGSGHFLIAAAHRMARKLAFVRTGDEEPSPEATRKALRDVIGRCIYGVDINPMAVELCKVSLWMEALEPGKPLSFLEHRIQCGNSLLGTTPALLEKGIPDDAFKPIAGDDKEICKEYKKRNKEEKKQTEMFAPDMQPWERLGDLAAGMMRLEGISDDTIEGVRRKQEQYERHVQSTSYEFGHLWADAWCAAFVWKKTKEFPYPITEQAFRQIERNPYSVPHWMRNEIERLAEHYQFFHWYMAFPDVFRASGKAEEPENEKASWSGGFDVILGNPPWEKITTLEREFFADILEIASEKRSNRRKTMIFDLQESNPILYQSWLEQKRFDQSCIHFLRSSGYFPMSAVGEINLYPLFVEAADMLIKLSGRAGIIIKTGMMVSPTWAGFSSYLLDHNRIQSAFDFRNWKGWFPAIGYHERFTLLTIKSESKDEDLVFAYYLDDPSEITSSKAFKINRQDALTLNPITKTVPAFESARDRDCVLTIYRRFPILASKEVGWNVRYTTGLHMSGEAEKLRDLEELISEGFEPDPIVRMCKGNQCCVPLYEGKLIHQFDHRFASFEGVPRKKRFGIKPGTYTPTEEQKDNPAYHITPRYWISEKDLKSDVEKRKLGANWSIAFRDTTNVISNFRTSVACICDGVAFNYKAPNIVLELATIEDRPIASVLFISLMNSFPFDYVVRQKFFGANFIKSILDQLAVPPMSLILEMKDFLLPKVLELTYTSWQLADFANSCGYDSPPFRWDEKRRFFIRCELDAAYFHIYKIERDDLGYIMETFPILKRREEEKYGEYRTKRVILEIYDDMAETMRTEKPYETILSPPPADPSVAHPRNSIDTQC